MSNFGKKCRQAGLTAYRISKDTGVNVQTVANWMRGDFTPKLSENLKNVLEYCQRSGVDVSFEDMMRNESV